MSPHLLKRMAVKWNLEGLDLKQHLEPQVLRRGVCLAMFKHGDDKIQVNFTVNLIKSACLSLAQDLATAMMPLDQMRAPYDSLFFFCLLKSWEEVKSAPYWGFVLFFSRNQSWTWTLSANFLHHLISQHYFSKRLWIRLGLKIFTVHINKQ